MAANAPRRTIAIDTDATPIGTGTGLARTAPNQAATASRTTSPSVHTRRAAGPASYDDEMSLLARSRRPIPGGPIEYRARIRRFGVVMGLVPAVAALAVGSVLLALGGSPLKGIPGFLLTAMSAPTMLLVGVPVTSGTARFVLAGVTSFVLWCGVGAWAAARATRNPMASWRDWWKEYLWLAVPIWIGAAVAFGVAYEVVL